MKTADIAWYLDNFQIYREDGYEEECIFVLAKLGANIAATIDAELQEYNYNELRFGKAAYGKFATELVEQLGGIEKIKEILNLDL